MVKCFTPKLPDIDAPARPLLQHEPTVSGSGVNYVSIAILQKFSIRLLHQRDIREFTVLEGRSALTTIFQPSQSASS
ncbi:uncharacterized protein PAC_19037 [Phialocephala subalpina]|uniref:Uncharacterized protein n=1 Tax=Phialocephala subalpina TaxID=576137 RepID=A0A1L7XVU1_9HELO|nr:uncharacterized protein PAC_19037 [Phialocephala subalpina]